MSYRVVKLMSRATIVIGDGTDELGFNGHRKMFVIIDVNCTGGVKMGKNIDATAEGRNDDIMVSERCVAQTIAQVFCKKTHKPLGWRILWDTKETGVLWLARSYSEHAIYER